MKMQIFVKDYLTGGPTMILNVDSEETVYSIMSQIEDKLGVLPIMQKLQYNCRAYLHDTPGTLADHRIDKHASVMVFHMNRGWSDLHRKMLVSLGFAVPEEELYDPSFLRGPDGYPQYPEQKLMIITVMDHIRLDGGNKRLDLFVVAENTVASIKEQVKRMRRYPVEMQLLKISDADSPDKERPMDKLDATLADYNVKDDSIINMYMDMEFALQADREERGKFSKGKEIVGLSEQYKLVADDQK